MNNLELNKQIPLVLGSTPYQALQLYTGEARTYVLRYYADAAKTQFVPLGNYTFTPSAKFYRGNVVTNTDGTSVVVNNPAIINDVPPSATAGLTMTIQPNVTGIVNLFVPATMTAAAPTALTSPLDVVVAVISLTASVATGAVSPDVIKPPIVLIYRWQ